MKEIFIKSAKTIIGQGGNCNNEEMIICSNCPANEKGDYETYCKKLNGVLPDKVKWFKNWLKENEETKMEKVQMTEEEFIRLILGCVSITKSQYGVPMLDLDYAVESAKKYNYIIKSELQTLVDEAEEIIKRVNENYTGMTNDELKKLITTIQALKKSHPELKE